MNHICRDIFRAIHEGKWLSIEYQNRDEKITKYWIGIQGFNAVKGILFVEGLHLAKYTIANLNVRIEAIQSSEIIEGSYYPTNQDLVEDIKLNPHKYQKYFDNVANLKILSYLEMCNRLDTVPYRTDFKLIHYMDTDSFLDGKYKLSQEQFQEIVDNFQAKALDKHNNKEYLRIQRLAMNVLSIHTSRGLYVLAYRQLNLDVKNKMLRADDEITICTEYTIDGNVKETIRHYLDAEEYELLKDFEANQEKIKDCIMGKNQQMAAVDDMPYVIGLGMDVILDLHTEYNSIIDMYQSGNVTGPIKAFFGDLLNQPKRRKTYPIALINKNVNLDQLLAINTAMKYPVAYIQGPPGTGKTNTIINTIITAFFNEKTVLFASYNNHPVEGVFEKLSNIKYKGNKIPFPILRIGSQDVMQNALTYIKTLYNMTRSITVYESTLDREKGDRIKRAKQLSNLLKNYEEILDLKDRKETINRLIDDNNQRQIPVQMLPYQVDLVDRQMRQINAKIDAAGTITEEDAYALLDDDLDELKKYLYYISARYIKRIDEPKNDDLKKILFIQDPKTQTDKFIKYLNKTECVKKLQRIFPIIVTTCISAHRLGKPEPLFDMTIIDEASQCNNAVSLVPIIRGEHLMLVGDPQQLSPVILLDEITNQQLRKRYSVQEDYDYRKNSIYKTYLACDAVSDEILLHYHYRCNEKIIQFNNKKYYNSKLRIKSNSNEEHPLMFIDVQSVPTTIKNTAPAEVEEIIKYAMANHDKSIGIVTPFVNQKKLIDAMIKEKKLEQVVCGTVHAFQGDEKDIILFSTAITERTNLGTYNWLKNNRELINVATSRAKDKLIILSNMKNIARLHNNTEDDDLFELIQYVKSNGQTEVTQKYANSRALGIKPFSTATEESFLQNLNHALENLYLSQNSFTVRKEVAIAQVFTHNDSHNDLFYSGRFDFVVYEKIGGQEIPVLAIELDGKEHFEDDVVKNRDRKKEEICRTHNLQLIRVENSYARRYHHIKEILINYFSIRH